MVKPVTQLGSTELASGLLRRNADRSLTLWFGPTLPPDAPASNWIPTPSSAYYGALYRGVDVSAKFQLTLRMYYPTPGDSPPSILPRQRMPRRRSEDIYPAGRGVGAVIG
jgi:hypothetical protein